jgi:hypothetical protein
VRDGVAITRAAGRLEDVVGEEVGAMCLVAHEGEQRERDWRRS